MTAEADEYEVTVTARFRFAAFSDRAAARRKAMIFSQIAKIAPYARRVWNIDLEADVRDPEKTGRRRTFR